MSRQAVVLERIRMDLVGRSTIFAVDLQITDGEWLLLVGPSGSGKSLILELAAGLVTPDEGRVLLFGKSWADGSEDQRTALRLQVGTALQRPGLLSNMTLFNNVALPLRYHRSALTNRDIEETVNNHLDRLGLLSAKNRFPAEATAGELRRAAIARAMVMDPRLLLLDDPAEGLDVDMTGRLCRYLEEVRAGRPLAIMMTLRCWSPLGEGADRVVALRDGHIVMDGSPSALREAADAEIKRYLT
jgi:ABC-type transporter Mla maintaining outer membrane lipid asymmetry ATPase subunit MlaF